MTPYAIGTVRRDPREDEKSVEQEALAVWCIPCLGVLRTNKGTEVITGAGRNGRSAPSVDRRKKKMDKRIIDEKAKSEMCLCKTCMIEFRNAGYRVERVRALQETMDVCDFCHERRGFDFYVTSKEKRG